MSVYAMCRETVDIQRATDSTDSGGFNVETFTNHITGQRAKVDRVAAREGTEYDRRAVRDQRTVFMPGVVDVTQSDRIVIGGVAYEVRGVSSSGAPGRAAAYTRADVERVK